MASLVLGAIGSYIGSAWGAVGAAVGWSIGARVGEPPAALKSIEEETPVSEGESK